MNDTDKKRLPNCPICGHNMDWHNETGCTLSYCDCKETRGDHMDEEKQDHYKNVAAEMFNVPYDEVTLDQRESAKSFTWMHHYAPNRRFWALQIRSEIPHIGPKSP
jgi:hypothetical protein